MKKLLKYILLLIVAFFFIGVFFPSEIDWKGANKRYDNATLSQKKCVSALNDGVYKDKSLTWKLDNCNVPE